MIEVIVNGPRRYASICTIKSCVMRAILPKHFPYLWSKCKQRYFCCTTKNKYNSRLVIPKSKPDLNPDPKPNPKKVSGIHKPNPNLFNDGRPKYSRFGLGLLRPRFSVQQKCCTDP